MNDPCGAREFGIMNSECGIIVDLIFVRLTPRSLRYVRKNTSVEMMGWLERLCFSCNRDDGESGTALLYFIRNVIYN